MKKIIFSIFLISSSLYSCFDSKQDDMAPATPPTLTLRSTNTSSINSRFKDFIGISEISEFQAYQRDLSLDLNNMKLIKFDQENNTLRAIVIPINSNEFGNKISKSLLISFKQDYSAYRFLLLEREEKVNSLQDFSGISRIKTMDEKVLVEEFIENNKSVKLLAHKVDESTLRNAKTGECTYGEWSFYYLTIKNGCAADAACDIACTVSGPVCAAGMALQALDYCMAFDYHP